MTAPLSFWHPSPAVPVLGSPSDTVVAAQAWPVSLGWPSGPHPVNAVVPAAAPRPRVAGCPGWPPVGAVVTAAGAAVRKHLWGRLAPGFSHQLCLEVWACCQPFAWSLWTPVVVALGDPPTPTACLPVPRAGRGWREVTRALRTKVTNQPASLLLLPHQGWPTDGPPKLSPGTSTVTIGKVQPGPPNPG